MRRLLLLRIAVCVAAVAGLLVARARATDLPLAPYDEVKPWGPAVAGSLDWEPAGMEAGSNGDVYLLRRSDPAIVVVNASGAIVRTIRTPPMVWAHGLHVDKAGNVWATDCGVGSPSKDFVPRNVAALEAGHGYQVYKFSPEGTLLMTLGTAGQPGDDTSHFRCPADVVTVADGSVFVSDGHGGPVGGARILKFTSDGRFITEWGRPGKGPGEFATPHALAIDSRGRLLVGDTGNRRIQLFDQEGRFLEQFTEFGVPAGIALTADDTMVAADNLAKQVTVGSARTGKATGVIPNTFAEPIAADNAGNVYVGEVHPHTWRKFHLAK